jgi:hypothetical protein
LHGLWTKVFLQDFHQIIIRHDASFDTRFSIWPDQVISNTDRTNGELAAPSLFTRLKRRLVAFMQANGRIAKLLAQLTEVELKI